MPKLITLTKRSDFKAVQKLGEKWVTKAFVVLACHSLQPQTATIHFGIITSGKVGTAVVRNRIRRRLKEVVRELLPEHGYEEYLYIIIARKEALDYPFETLKRDLIWSLDKIHERIKAKANDPR